MTLRNMSSCAIQMSAEEGADQLYAFMKSAEDNQLENNRQVPGMQPDAYPSPPAREEREETADALWGQEPQEEAKHSRTGQMHSNAAWDGFRAGRERFLERNFSGFAPSRTQALSELSGSLEHFRSGDHESSKPFTNEHSNRNPEIVETVFERTKRVLGA